MDTTNERVERERALNRDRQARYRARKRNGNNATLPPLHEEPGWWNTDKERRIAVELAAGNTARGALRAIGSSETSVQLIEHARSGLAEALKSEGLSIKRVIQGTKELLDATSPVLTANGSIEKPAWDARDKGLRHSMALLDRAGELPSPQPTGHAGTTIQVAIVIPQDVVGERRISDGQDTLTVQLPDNIE